MRVRVRVRVKPVDIWEPGVDIPDLERALRGLPPGSHIPPSQNIRRSGMTHVPLHHTVVLATPVPSRLVP